VDLWLPRPEINPNCHVDQNSVSVNRMDKIRASNADKSTSAPPNFQHRLTTECLPEWHPTKPPLLLKNGLPLHAPTGNLAIPEKHCEQPHSNCYCSGDAKPQANVSGGRVPTFRHDQCWKSRRCQSGADGVTLLSDIHSAVPAPPDLGWGKHAASTTHLCSDS